MKLSIIIPCYNSAKTIRRCLDSIYALPLPEDCYEVIVVNDGSVDETGSIVAEYGKAHDNLTLIRHLVNRNLGGARNTGIAASKGECIAFVDSDDEVAPGLTDALNKMLEMQLDMVALHVETVGEDGAILQKNSFPYSSDSIVSGIQLQEKHPFRCIAVWGYLFRRLFLEDVQYPFVEGNYFEDADYVLVHLYHVKRLSYCESLSYRYHQTPGSISHSFSHKTSTGYLFLGSRLLSLFEMIGDRASPYALSVLERSYYSVNAGFRKMLKLPSVDRIRSVFNEIDSYHIRKHIRSSLFLRDRLSSWTQLCLRHRFLATTIAGLVVSVPSLQRLLRRLRNRICYANSK